MVDGIAKSDIAETEQRLDELEVVLARLKGLAVEVCSLCYFTLMVCSLSN